MNKEEFLKAIMELPKVETINPISAMNSINIDDLMSAVDRLNKVPDYNDLLKENKKLQEELKCTIGIVEHNRIISEKNKETHQLKDNWNKLKEKTNEGIRICRNKGYDLVFDIEEIPKEELDDFLSYLAFQVMEQLIINIEQGSDSNVKD